MNHNKEGLRKFYQIFIAICMLFTLFICQACTASNVVVSNQNANDAQQVVAYAKRNTSNAMPKLNDMLDIACVVSHGPVPHTQIQDKEISLPSTQDASANIAKNTNDATVRTNTHDNTTSTTELATETPMEMETETESESATTSAAESQPTSEPVTKPETETTSEVPTETTPLYPSLPAYSPTSNDYALLQYINDARVANGLSALSMSNTLCSLAFVRATEITSCWSHTRPNGESCTSVFTEYGVCGSTKRGENLAHFSYFDAQSIVNTWMESEGHRANILRDAFTTIGIATYTVNGQYYIANIFTN